MAQSTQSMEPLAFTAQLLYQPPRPPHARITPGVGSLPSSARWNDSAWGAGGDGDDGVGGGGGGGVAIQLGRLCCDITTLAARPLPRRIGAGVSGVKQATDMLRQQQARVGGGDGRGPGGANFL